MRRCQTREQHGSPRTGDCFRAFSSGEQLGSPRTGDCLRAFSSGAVTTRFNHLGSVGLEHTTLRMRWEL